MCLRIDPQQPPVTSAYRAGDPSVHYDYLTTFWRITQCLHHHFFRICELFNYTSSTLSNKLLFCGVQRVRCNIPCVGIMTKGVVHLIAPVHPAICGDINAARIRPEVLCRWKLRTQ